MTEEEREREGKEGGRVEGSGGLCVGLSASPSAPLTVLSAQMCGQAAGRPGGRRKRAPGGIMTSPVEEEEEGSFFSPYLVLSSSLSLNVYILCHALFSLSLSLLFSHILSLSLSLSLALCVCLKGQSALGFMDLVSEFSSGSQTYTEVCVHLFICTLYTGQTLCVCALYFEYYLKWTF